MGNRWPVPAFPGCSGRAWDDWVDRDVDGGVRRRGVGRSGVADDVVPQGNPSVLTRASGLAGAASVCGRASEAGRNVDQVASQGRSAGHGVVASGEDTRGAQQVVRDRRTAHPGAVRSEPARRDMGQRPVDQVGEMVSMMACWRWVISASAVGSRSWSQTGDTARPETTHRGSGRL